MFKSSYHDVIQELEPLIHESGESDYWESIAYIIQLVMNHQFSFEKSFVGAPREMPGIDNILTRVWHVKKHTSPRIQETLNTIIEYVLCQSLHLKNRAHICINIELLYASETFSEKNQKLILNKKNSIYVTEKTKDILEPFVDKIIRIFDDNMKNKDPIQTLHAAYDKCSYSPMLFYTVFGNFMDLIAKHIVSDKEYERLIKTFGLGSLLDLSLNEKFYLPESVLKMNYANRADLLMRHDIKLSPPVRINVLSALQKHYDLSLSMYEYIYKYRDISWLREDIRQAFEMMDLLSDNPDVFNQVLFESIINKNNHSELECEIMM